MIHGLHHWPRPTQTVNSVSRSPRAIVFVHGILSNNLTFERMQRHFSGNPRLGAFEFFYYNYDYNESLEQNGKKLADELANHFVSDDSVAIVAHSMGGLVSRLAILSRRLEFVHWLFLLGTPNVGAIRTAQLSLLAELIRHSASKIGGLFPRKQGILELTRAMDILRKHQRNARYADGVDYISIPGLFFYGDRSWIELPRDNAGGAFAALRVGLSLLKEMTPLGVNLEKPHDGIVEESSNKLMPSTENRINEKNDTINFTHKGPHTYAHVEVTNCRELTHVHIHCDLQVFNAIASIIVSGDDDRRANPPRSDRLERWTKSLPKGGDIVNVQFR